MTRFSRPFCSIGFALTLATPALADLTPQQVWDSWKTMGAEMGQTVAVGSETLSGGTLSLTDVAFTVTMPDGTVNGTIPSLVFQQDNGSVTITMSPQYDMRIQMDPANGEAIDMTMQIAAPGLETTASGTPDNITYRFNGPDIKVALADMVVEGEPVDMDLTVALTRLVGEYTLTSGDAFAFNSAFNAETMAVAVEGRDQDDPTVGLTLNAAYEAVTTQSNGSGPALMNVGDPAAMFADDSTFFSSFAHRGGTIDMVVRDPEGGDFSFVSNTATGSISANLAEGAMDYAGLATGLDVKLSGAQIPFPELTATMEQFGVGLKMPLIKSETPKDFGLNLNLAGLTVSDFLWGMIDPGAALPRDPATLLINLTGQAKLLMDLTSPEASQSASMPGELHALNLNELRLSLAGAELTGNGAFTFDNSDTSTFGGMPAPNGAVDLKLVGGTTLLGKLVELGLIPQDQAMGAQMMLGLFATPAGDDTLTSKIEVTPDGGISANGQRLQ